MTSGKQGETRRRRKLTWKRTFVQKVHNKVTNLCNAVFVANSKLGSG